MNLPKVLTLSVVVSTICACHSSSINAAQPIQISAQQQTLDISAIPDSLSDEFSAELGFNRYTAVMAPNGKAIPIIAQYQITDEQMVRVRSILKHYLTDYPGSRYGADKSAVANKMAENSAILMLLNGYDDGNNPALELNAQPLYHDEIQVEGGDWYIRQDYEHRDASYEEILHLVHDYGIGVDGYDRFYGALPEYQAQIRSAQQNASASKLWGISDESEEWLIELSEENSLSQEYLASVIDSYYGLWGAWSESLSYGMWGEYIAKTRTDIKAKDPMGAQLMNTQFFHPYITYNARISAGFNGDFSLRFDINKPYTHHAQYLKDITLTGNNPSGVVVNQYDNNITGNLATNRVIFSGYVSEYKITKQKDGGVMVEDQIISRDGSNQLQDIEQLVFTDTVVDI